MAKERASREVALVDRDPSDPLRKEVELIQRGRMIVDVSQVDLDAAESLLGAFHATTWYFRAARDESLRSWDRLIADFGAEAVENALARPPISPLELTAGVNSGNEPALLIAIDGKTYHAERVAGTPPAPIQWKLDRLRPPLEHGPYYVCRLREGSTQCDCAEWTFRVAEPVDVVHAPCKHVTALKMLGWL